MAHPIEHPVAAAPRFTGSRGCRPAVRSVPSPAMAALAARLDAADARTIGFPVGRLPVDWSPLLPLTLRFLNNLGDAAENGLEPRNVKDLERVVLATLADWFGAPRGDRWGVVLDASSRAVLHALRLGRSRYPDARGYLSTAAHPCVADAMDALGLPAVVVPAAPSGEMDYAALAEALDPARPAIVCATAGTTTTEAVDDTGRIRQVAAARGVTRLHLHLDAALAGVPLALSPWRRCVRLGPGGADSLNVSGHKFLSTPVPCGVLLARRQDAERVTSRLSYVAVGNATGACSRDGHASLQLFHVLRQLGADGLAREAERARGVAGYAVARLRAIGHDARRHPWGFTVAFPAPPPTVVARWALATDALGTAHLIAMPGITHATVDAFVADLAAASGQPS